MDKAVRDVKREFEIKYSDGKFWMLDSDEFGEYEAEITNFDFINALAQGFKFSVAMKEKATSRKWRPCSPMTYTVEAQLPIVKELLKTHYLVKVLTPDLEIIFFQRLNGRII